MSEPTAPRAPWLLDQPYAHRGLWNAARPENSMAAFMAAADAKLGIELDVRLSADDVVMVFHDATLERMAGARGALAERSAQHLSALKLGKTSETIPRLADVLAAAPNAHVLVEMKVSPGSEGPLEKQTAALLAQHKGPVAAMSFNPRTLALFAEYAPGVPCGQLFSAWPGAAPDAMQWLKRTLAGTPHKADFLASGLDALAGHGRPAAEALKLPLLAWTIKTVGQLRSAWQAEAQQVIFENLPPDIALRPRAQYM